MTFLLTRPSQGVTSRSQSLQGKKLFLLTRPSQGVTDSGHLVGYYHDISTHTPLAGRDFEKSELTREKIISTHTPLAGRDYWCYHDATDDEYFYSHAPRRA